MASAVDEKKITAVPLDDGKNSAKPVSLDEADEKSSLPKIAKINIYCCGEKLEFLIDENSWQYLKRIEYISFRAEMGISELSIPEMNRYEFQLFIKLLIKHPLLDVKIMNSKQVTEMFEDIDMVMFFNKYAVDTSKLVKHITDAKQCDIHAILKNSLIKSLNFAIIHFDRGSCKGKNIELKYGSTDIRISIIRDDDTKNIQETLHIKKIIHGIEQHFESNVKIVWRRMNIVFFLKDIGLTTPSERLDKLTILRELINFI